MTVSSSIIQLISQYRKKLLLIIGTVTLLALVISLLMPEEYMSQASILPANSKMMDKQRLFGANIQELYSAYGNADDLDRLYATMRSSAVLNFVADSFHLLQHYHLENARNGAIKSYKKMQKNIELLKTEYGEIRIRVWDKDPAMAANIANTIISRTRVLSDKMFTEFYELSIEKMTGELSGKTVLIHSLKDSSADERKELEAEAAVIRNRMMEYRVTLLNPPPALFILDKAEPSTVADRPYVLLNVFLGFLLAAFSSFLWLAITHAGKWS
jgi:capsular polysaccharide biosynthesis protein